MPDAETKTAPSEPIDQPTVHGEFRKYRGEVIGEIKKAQELFIEPLSDNPVTLENQAAMAEAVYGRLTSIEAFGKSYLALARRAYLEPKSKETTELEREINLDAEVHEEQRFVDVVHGLLKSLEQRISLSQSIMKAAAVEGRRTNSTA